MKEEPYCGLLPHFPLGSAMAETTTGEEPLCVINKPWFPALAMPSQHNTSFFDNQVTGVYQSGQARVSHSHKQTKSQWLGRVKIY